MNAGDLFVVIIGVTVAIGVIGLVCLVLTQLLDDGVRNV